MLTKREACHAVILDYCISEGKEPEELGDADIYTSSKLAVSMEFLGMIESEDSQNYATSRGGMILFIFTDEGETKILTFRELLELLPDK